MILSPYAMAYWHGSASYSNYSSINSEEENYSFGRLDLNGGYSFKNKITLNAGFGLTRQFTHEDRFGEVSDLGDIRSSLSGTFFINRYKRGRSLGLGWRLNNTLPASRISRKRKLNTAFGASMSLFGRIRRWQLSQSLGGNYAYYEYEAQGSEVYSPYSLSSSSSLSYRFTRRLSLSTGFNYVYSIDFKGTTKGYTNTNLSLNYGFLRNLSLSLGFSTDSGVLSASGTNYDIKLFGANETLFFFSFSFST